MSADNNSSLSALDASRPFWCWSRGQGRLPTSAACVVLRRWFVRLVRGSGRYTAARPSRRSATTWRSSP